MAECPIHVLIIGYNQRVLKEMGRSIPCSVFYVIEEEELYRAVSVDESLFAELRFGGYQQSLDCADVAISWSEKIAFDAVLPAREYAVMAANEVARRLGKPRLGDLAASVFTDKLALRRRLGYCGILQPRYAGVAEASEVHAFFDGNPVVLKPRNRQSSVGVVLIRDREDIDLAWRQSSQSDEVGHLVRGRELTWTYLVEEQLRGDQVSVESVVNEGHARFHNVTAKLNGGVTGYVEIGHTVPAPLSEATYEELLIAQEMLICAAEVGTAILHSEWALTSDGPRLIECAGRAPGDNITTLIELVYGQTLFKMLLEPGSLSTSDRKCVAGVRFFTPNPGRVERISGLEEVHSIPQVVHSHVSVDVGDTISPLTSSWSRPGFLILVADDFDALEKAAQRALQTVVFETR